MANINHASTNIAVIVYNSIATEPSMVDVDGLPDDDVILTSEKFNQVIAKNSALITQDTLDELNDLDEDIATILHNSLPAILEANISTEEKIRLINLIAANGVKLNTAMLSIKYKIPLNKEIIICLFKNKIFFHLIADHHLTWELINEQHPDACLALNDYIADNLDLPIYNIDYETSDACDLLCIAIKYHAKPEIVQTILQAKAAITHTHYTGTYPLHDARSYTALILAVINNRIDLLEMLIYARNQANHELLEDEDFPMSALCFSNDLERALIISVCIGNAAITQILLGATLNLNLRIEDKHILDHIYTDLFLTEGNQEEFDATSNCIIAVLQTGIAIHAEMDKDILLRIHSFILQTIHPKNYTAFTREQLTFIMYQIKTFFNEDSLAKHKDIIVYFLRKQNSFGVSILTLLTFNLDLADPLHKFIKKILTPNPMHLPPIILSSDRSAAATRRILEASDRTEEAPAAKKARNT